LQARLGLDLVVIWGLAVGRDWPVDIAASVDARRAAQVRHLIESAHTQGIRVMAGTGVYSWGFEAIIKAHPELSRGNPRAMCASNPESWHWMERVLDFTGGVLGVDGFSFQSADQGRCPCEQCARWGDVEYHARLNERVAAYVKARWPEKLVAINCWGLDLADPADLPHVQAMTRQADYLIDARNTVAARDPGYRRRLIEAIAPCAFGTVGGPYVEPPLHWQRTRWFLPCLDRAAAQIKSVYADGGQAMEVFMHIQANPGDEVTLQHSAALLRDPRQDSEVALRSVLADLYQPRDNAALDHLVELFLRADRAYFSRAHTLPGGGTLSLEPLVNDRVGPPVYLTEHLDHEGLRAYERDLHALLAQCPSIAAQVGRPGKISLVAACLQGALTDVATAIARVAGHA
jgi:hypothetical protein